VAAIETMISQSFLLEPISIFLYTWCFLPSLEENVKNEILKKIYRYYKVISILIVPAIFLGLYTALVVSASKGQYFYVAGA